MLEGGCQQTMPAITLNPPSEVPRQRGFRPRRLIHRIGGLEYGSPETAVRRLAHSIIKQMPSMKVG